MKRSFANNAQNYSKRSAKYIYDEMRDGGPIGMAAYLILVILIGVFCKVISINVAPYLIVFGDATPKPSNILIIGWAYDVLNLLMNASAAMLAWFILNLAQCLWILLGFDTDIHRNVLGKMTAEKKIQEMEGSTNSSSIRQMRRKALKLPSFIFIYSRWIGLGAYVAEALINIRAYPFVNEPGKFFMMLALRKFEVFNLENIFKFAWGMASTEVFVIAIVLALIWAKSKRNPAISDPIED
jgi:hypothetical protein